MEKTYYNIEN